jgi:hypothetical protein
MTSEVARREVMSPTANFPERDVPIIGKFPNFLLKFYHITCALPLLQTR